MKREIKPLQAAVIVVVALILVLGLGYYFVIGRNATQDMPMPAASSRADMVRQFHAVKLGGNALGQRRGGSP